MLDSQFYIKMKISCESHLMLSCDSLVYTKQENNAFRALWSAKSEVIGQVTFPLEQTVRINLASCLTSISAEESCISSALYNKAISRTQK